VVRAERAITKEEKEGKPKEKMAEKETEKPRMAEKETEKAKGTVVIECWKKYPVARKIPQAVKKTEKEMERAMEKEPKDITAIKATKEEREAKVTTSQVAAHVMAIMGRARVEKAKERAREGRAITKEERVARPRKAKVVRATMARAKEARVAPMEMALTEKMSESLHQRFRRLPARPLLRRNFRPNFRQVVPRIPILRPQAFFRLLVQQRPFNPPNFRPSIQHGVPL